MAEDEGGTAVAGGKGGDAILAEEAVAVLRDACPGMGKAEAETRLGQAIKDGELPAATAVTYQARQEAIVKACEARDKSWRPLVEERRAEWLREVGFPRHEFAALVARAAADWEPRWSPTAAVAWVLCRDPAMLRELGSDPSGTREGAVMWRAECQARRSLRIERARTLDQAEAELRRLGAEGKIRAEGERNGAWEPIPADAWKDLGWSYEGAGRRAVSRGEHRHYDDLRFSRVDVMREWPERQGEAAPDAQVADGPPGVPQVADAGAEQIRAAPKRTRGYRADDEPLWQEMEELIKSKEARTSHGAAKKVAGKAKGHSEDAKIARLRKGHKAWAKNRRIGELEN